MYPLDIQYKHSVQNKIYPPNNGGYVFTPVMEEDEVVFSAGGKACVFKVKDDGDNKTKALKLFTLDSEDRFHRFKQIAKALQAVPSNIFIGFSFIPKLIFVKIENQADGECYFPGLVMDWVEGVTLATKVSELCEKTFLISFNK